MLQPTSTGQVNLTPQAYFYDKLNQELYYLHEGQLRSYHLIAKSHRQIHLNLSSSPTPALSSRKLITISGEDSVANADKNIISTTTNLDKLILRSPAQIQDGSSWEWHAPLSLRGIKLGICQQEQNQTYKYQFFKFNSSTSRTVTFSVQGEQLSVWVNGHKPSKNPTKKVTYDNDKNKWYPYVQLQERGNTIVYLPFSTLKQNGKSIYNIFGKINDGQPKNDQIDQAGQILPIKIKNIIQLTPDKFLLVWENNHLKTIERNPLTLKFDILPFSVHEDVVSNLFSPEQYGILKSWRGQNKLFQNKSNYQLLSIYSWLRYLIVQLDKEHSQKQCIYLLLLAKLALIRPYLENKGVYIPNIIPALEFDVKNSKNVFKYFNINPKMVHIPLAYTNSNTQYKVEGNILGYTENYLISRHQNHLIIYNTKDQFTQIFRQTLQKKHFSKRKLVQSFEESDKRYIKSEGSSLYKILIDCLQKQKKSDELHAVNQNDVKQLIRDYGIDEKSARIALEHTGHVEQALVWIFTDKGEDKIKKGESIEQNKVDQHQIVKIIQLQNSFARLILLVGKKLFLIGVLPSQIRKFIFKGQRQYIDLVTLKHQENISNINLRSWFSEGRHPRLHILDQIQTKIAPELLYKQGENIYVLVSQEGMYYKYYKKQINFNNALIYESQSSLSEGVEQIPLSSFVSKEELQTTVKGELICKGTLTNKYLQNSIWADQNNIYDNISKQLTNVAKCLLKLKEPIDIRSADEVKSLIPFIVERGPPGCNNNYSISSLLQPKSSFLANYPQQIVLRHLHNKLVNINSITIERSIHRKNINFITEGDVYFIDEWGNKSNNYHFSFAQNQQRLQISLNDTDYWKYLVLTPKFTTFKKQPFEIGYISAEGLTISSNLYIQQYTRKVIELLSSKTTRPISILNVQKTPENVIQINLKLHKEEDLQEIQKDISQLKIFNRSYSAKASIQTIQLENLSPAQLIKSMTDPYKLENILRGISRSTVFNFQGFSQDQVCQFVDLAIYYTGNFKSNDYYANLFKKIWQNESGQKYLLRLTQSISQFPTIPYQYIKLLLKHLSVDQHKQAIGSILKLLPNVKSKLYNTNENKSPYLLFQTNFYSSYYFGLLQPKNQVKTKEIYDQSIIQSEFIVFKDENSRRIIIKLSSQHFISNFALRFERCDVSSRVNYNIFSINSNGKSKVGSGRILEHQWSQITKNNYTSEQQVRFMEISKELNVYGLQFQPTVTQYLEIQLLFSETGIVGHNNDSLKVPQIDLLPELYGYSTGKVANVAYVDDFFTINPEQLFFLSSNPLGALHFHKYSVSKGKSAEYVYFKIKQEDQASLVHCIQQRIQRKDLESLVSLQRRLIKNTKKFSNKICLDYLYTILILSLQQLQNGATKLEDSLCELIFQNLIKCGKGPIKYNAFRSISHNIPLMVKSLQYVEEELPQLGKISFSYEQLQGVIDLNNRQLCKSLTRLILRAVEYEPKWAEILIKMASKTDSHEEIVKYFISKDDWLLNSNILDYISTFSDEFFSNIFLLYISYSQLCKLVIKPSSKPRLQLLLTFIVEKASVTNPVDLDVVSLIFQQKQVRWEQLQKVVTCCPEAIDTVIHQFLQAQNPQVLSLQHYKLLEIASQPKYAEEFATFLGQIYKKDIQAFKLIFLSFSGKCKTLHYDFLQTINHFIITSCNFGGIQGVRLLGQRGLSNLQTAVQMLKVVQKAPEAAELPSENGLIEWYLNNNDYEHSSGNPANKSPGYQLMRQLADLVLNILKTSTPVKILTKYAELVDKIKNSRKMQLSRKHLLFYQLHHGASELLGYTLTPGSLAQVLVGPNNPLLLTVIKELKASVMKNSKSKWIGAKEIDITDKFQAKNTGQQIKELQSGRGGSKIPICKIAINQQAFKIQSENANWPSKFVVGFCLNDHADNKTAILPSRVQLFGGNGTALTKIGDLHIIQDQFYLAFGVRIFGINLNNIVSIGTNAIKVLQLKFHEPILSSTSEILENGQRSKKGATYNLSFINVSGYDSLPTEQPEYSQLYSTLLGFLGQQKYLSDFKKVIASQVFDQKLQLIIQVLNDLLPNEKIQKLLLLLNRQGENVLEHILKLKVANPKLVSLLILGKLTKDNINKLLAYTLENLSQEFVNIVIMSLRLASYTQNNKANAKSIADFANIQRLVGQYQKSEGQNKQFYFQIITSLLTVSNIYNYQISKLVNFVWEKSDRKNNYHLLAAVLPYHLNQLQNFSLSGYTLTVFEELISILELNHKSDSVVQEPFSQLVLINTLTLNSNSRDELLEVYAPIKIVELLKSKTSLLIKYSSDTMKQIINFFQNTCINSNCQDQFSQILINFMTSLNEFQSIHHQYFIENLFFPLINAFKGVPLFFVWKQDKNYTWRPTDVLKRSPIRSNSKVISHKGKFYSPIQILDETVSKNSLIIVLKENNNVLYNLSQNVLTDIQSNKKIPFSLKDGKLYIEVEDANSLILPHQKYKICEETNWQFNLLTNATLINLHNPRILQQKYRSISPISSSTTQNCYFLPLQITLNELMKQINISGLRIHSLDLPEIKIRNYLTDEELSKQLTLKQLLQNQKLPYLKLQIETSQLFKNITIESLANEEIKQVNFVPQETIFKAFEEKKGLQKLIGVLTGCVKNWVNAEQSKIWGQYLNELESYSCFPVFSSLYMTKQSNVSLLFDLLLGLPDKQESKKWIQKQKEAVHELYDIIKDVFAVQGQSAIIVREYALKSGFYSTMLNRLHLVTKQQKRYKVQQQSEEQEIVVPTNIEKKLSEEQFKAKLIKRKGVGYGTDSSTNQKWDVTGQQQARKQQSEQILGLLNILQKFLDYKDFDFPESILQETYESSLLPIIQSSLRGGSLLEISKYAELFQGQLNFIQVLARCKRLIPTLMPLPKLYQPKQPQSLHSLLKTLANTSKIFLSCLTGSASEKISQEIAKKTSLTFEIVQQAISEFAITHVDEEEQKKILQLPLAKKYPILMKDLRFDYMDMKDSNGKISKHHYASYYTAGHKSPVEKTVRLAQELADVSHALPIDHTNAIFVRCDKERVDYMQAMIMGSNGTPYGHGAYLFDIYFEDNYPNGPPKVNLTTTGSGQIRFNPNLYACGKVCLSLLGTWRGNAMQNWDAKVSTLLQVLVSIQSIIMSQDIYFNEPGFQHEQGTLQGQKKNEAYANIVRYGNVKFAMIENIKNPPKGFESIVRRHFYLKQGEILEECQKWLKLADKRQASYTGLVSDHNYNWCNTFKKSKTEYKNLLEKAVNQLEAELKKLPIPTNDDLKKQVSALKQKKQKKQKTQTVKQDTQFEQIDVSYGATRQLAELDINDERVKDRWSRYIGAMGVQAVSKQSKASILLIGLGGLGIQIAKNIVLSGCKQFSIWDTKLVGWQDLSGQFFLGQSDIGKSRLQSSIYKLQQLNHYVKVSKFDYNPQNLANLTKYNVVIATEAIHQEQLRLDEFCRENKISFVSADCYGPFGQIFNDFGENFEVLDKNGEQTVELIIEEITNAENGRVKVSKIQRHPYEDGDTVRLVGIKGMKKLSNQQQNINGTLHKVKSIDPYTFEIGNTLDYSPYESQGTVRNIKTPSKISFKSLIDSSKLQNIDSNLQYYDYSKGAYLRILHLGLIALSRFRSINSRLPYHWNKEDAEKIVQYVKEVKSDLSEDEIKYLRIFSYTCSGNFGPICAFFGGFVAQQVFKAITGKYTPINQYFLVDFSQIVETPPEDESLWDAFVEGRKSNNDRAEGIRRIIGRQLLNKLQNSKVFMVGSGAIGCQLLKNFAMLEIGTGETSGSIVVTDPDHIETSNLNRQFLFREKHLRKPKSATAAAAVVQMNSRLKGHIKARLDKVCQSTKDIFTSQFFQGLTIVANALDNVQARRYVDSRCVQSKIPLLQSGTLSSKGHVQVIIPYKTETYGSKQDPNDANGEVPHCTLKMFPEETIHCVEWARDLFGKQFTLSPKALAKLIQPGTNFTPGPSDIQMLKDCLKMLQVRPANFQQAVCTATSVFYQIFRNDIMQLLYTYPLDAKTKDGKPFWRLPKRPPTPIEKLVAEDSLHATFISSYAVLLSKIHNIPYPKDFRDASKREQIAKTATSFKIAQFVPSDKLAKQMAQQVNNQQNKQNTQKVKQQQAAVEGEAELYQRFSQILKNLTEGGQVVDSKPEQFQKDQDSNGHIDLIYSMANLRASNYKLEPLDWINVKLKAGRIMPALSTTTSCIAALQTIQLVKYIKGCSLQSLRNAFINLAVPVVQLSEPGEVQKIKVHSNLSTNLWERWAISISKQSTLGQLIKVTEQKYGITVKGLDLLEGGQVYSDIVLSLESKKAEKEKLLTKKVQQIISENQEENNNRFVDFTLLMAVDDNLIKHAPTLRLVLE